MNQAWRELEDFVSGNPDFYYCVDDRCPGQLVEHPTDSDLKRFTCNVCGTGVCSFKKPKAEDEAKNVSEHSLSVAVKLLKNLEDRCCFELHRVEKEDLRIWAVEWALLLDNCDKQKNH